MRGRHVLVGAVALVALAGCHDGGHQQATPAVTVSPAVTASPAAASARNAYLDRLRAIDPKLAEKPEVAIAKGEGICADIAKNLRWDEIFVHAEASFGVGDAEMNRILPMTQDELCPDKP